jgi:hypothetical protein
MAMEDYLDDRGLDEALAARRAESDAACRAESDAAQLDTRAT